MCQVFLNPGVEKLRVGGIIYFTVAQYPSVFSAEYSFLLEIQSDSNADGQKPTPRQALLIGLDWRQTHLHLRHTWSSHTPTTTFST